jgi:putative transposase
MIERCEATPRGKSTWAIPSMDAQKPESANTRHGTGTKTLKSEHGELDIAVPRDRDGSFEPLLVKKRQSRLEGFEEKILALYARGMTTRDIQAQVQELYGVEVSPTFISKVTEEVMEEVRECAESASRATVSYPVCGLPGS